MDESNIQDWKKLRLTKISHNNQITNITFVYAHFLWIS